MILDMRLARTAHTSQPWRIHAIAGDFRLEDVWALPTPGGHDDFSRLVLLTLALDPGDSASCAIRSLFALRWQIGVIEHPLTRIMRGHQGLSALAQTYRDYLEVVERFVAHNMHLIDPRDRDAALLHAYARNARGMLYEGNVTGALTCAVKSVARARSGGDAWMVGKLGFDLAKGLAVRARRALRGEAQAEKRG